MAQTKKDDDVKRVLDGVRVRDGVPQLLAIGTFEKGVTVLNQQIRALNLAWALVENADLAPDLDPVVAANAGPAEPPRADVPPDDTPVPTPDGAESDGRAAVEASSGPRRRQVAVIGAGFAGMTVAAAILRKQCAADVYLFERRDNVLPLQQGSDSRWLHPHIYDWPKPGSESSNAALPVLNWTAGRASDVVVQALQSWADIVDAMDSGNADGPSLQVFCNTRNLQVAESGSGFQIEWIGERRSSRDPSQVADQTYSEGRTAKFDIVILALGFGVEEGAVPYWRNETLAQPLLEEGRKSYIVSGAGDGGVIDLLRLRVTQFRQDRVLYELFGDQPELHRRLKEAADADPPTRFAAFEEISRDHAQEIQSVVDRLRKRLRRDTEVVLHVKAKTTVEQLFAPPRLSFQNSVLLYLLYRCGGFHVSWRDLDDLQRQLGVSDGCVVLRHGTSPGKALEEVLSKDLLNGIANSGASASGSLTQTMWPGGYFDFAGTEDFPVETQDFVKAAWRKEYLPGPTQLLATTFCSSVAGLLIASSQQPANRRLRVTFHRALPIGRQTWLQQCCEYEGLALSEEHGLAGRTFAAGNGTIGLAYSTRQVVRTRRNATHEALERDMERLELLRRSRTMATEVRSVLAVPLLGGPQSPSRNAAVRPVLGVLYIDSNWEDFLVEDHVLRILTTVCTNFLSGLEKRARPHSRIANNPFWQAEEDADEPRHTPKIASELAALEALTEPRAPVAQTLQVINFDQTDFVRTSHDD